MSDYHRKKTCEEENNVTTLKVKYKEKNKLKNLATDLDNFVTNEFLSLRDYLKAKKHH